jgi:prophage regulatory protein
MRLLRFSELKARGVPWTRAHVDRQEKSGNFPRRVRLGDSTVAWVEQEIDEFLAEKIAARESSED